MQNVRGFTLIEMIVVLLLMGILAAGAGLFLINGVQSYMFSSKNSTETLKVQNALERITQELRNAETITAPTSAASSNTITYSIIEGTVTVSKTISFNSPLLTITGYQPNGDPLNSSPNILDNIQNSSSVSVLCDNLDPNKGGSGGIPVNEVKSVDVSLVIDGIPNAFTTKVYPRNLLTCPYI